MKRLMTLLVTLCLLVSLTSTIYAINENEVEVGQSTAEDSRKAIENIGTKQDIFEIKQVIETFMQLKYNAIANNDVSKKLVSVATNKNSKEEISFLQEEDTLLETEVALLKNSLTDIKYCKYNLSFDYGKFTFLDAQNVYVDVSVVCKFNYAMSPNVDSEQGNIYSLQLKKDENIWGIIDRENTTTFDKIFFGDQNRKSIDVTARSIEILSKSVKNSKIEAANISVEMLNDQPILTAAASTGSYSRTGASNTAIAYVAPQLGIWYQWSAPDLWSKTKVSRNRVSA